MENNEVTDLGPIVSGTMTSTYSGGAYTMVINGKDDLGNTITGTLAGAGATTAAHGAPRYDAMQGSPYIWAPAAIAQSTDKAATVIEKKSAGKFKAAR